MLRSSRILCNKYLSGNFRKYHYQTEIYNNDLIESRRLNTKLNETLRQENEILYEKAKSEPNLYRFIKAYRQYGFKIGSINPLRPINNNNNQLVFELDPSRYGLDNTRNYSINGLLFSCQDNEYKNLNEIENYLKDIYSSNLTIEFEHLLNEEEKLWIAKEFENISNHKLDSDTRVNILKLLVKSQAFDQFLAKKFPSFKRYSLEGGESAMAFYQSFFSSSALSDIEQLVLGIAHRGRLNLMVSFLGLSPQLLFTKIKGKSEFSSDVKTASGDISHHFPCSTDLTFDGKKIHLNLLPNPSHLEAVDPVVLGKARSKQMYLKDGFYADEPSLISNKVMSLLIHGDAAFAGQGIVTETFQLSKLPNYAVGGTVHLLVNNQLGFTNPSHLGGSGKYNSDLAKGYDCPIIHVNGDNPELAYKAANFAVKYRNLFGKDIIVDLVCYRRWGHNELDDPTFTNPEMYKIIHNRKNVPELYEDIIINNEGLCTKDEIESELKNYNQYLEDALNEVNSGIYKIEPRNTYLKNQWSAMNKASHTYKSHWNTGCDISLLKYVGAKSVSIPSDFKVHPTISRAHIKKREEMIKDGNRIDWSTAESLAFGSLLTQGFNIRISGQDVGRGTFSQRHCLLVDQETNKTYIPLNNLNKNQKNFIELCNSHLSEEAVLGFDYGFSLDNPNNLVIWEAQFGDFFNGAQIILDTYISCSEVKWMHQSGIVMLLPHGYDGAGPEHTSCRIERFLQSCSSKENGVDSDDINYYIVHPTTPAQYFHLLRRQMIQPYRKPLIVAAPKVLLRLPEAVSNITDMDSNTSFQPVLNDPTVTSKDAIRRIIFVFGKHYYTLTAEKLKRNLNDIAIIRLEELCPFPVLEIRNTLNEFKNVKEFIWAQEEHQNMGAWSFIKPRFENLLGIRLNYAGRDVSCVPAAGIGELHNQEVKFVISKPFEKF